MEVSNKDSMDSIKEESSGFNQSKMYNNTKRQNDQNESPVTASTFFVMCPKYEMNEPMVKTQCDNLFYERVQNPVGGNSVTKAAVECVIDHFSSELENEPKRQTEESKEEEKYNLTNNEKPESIENKKSINKKQKRDRKITNFEYKKHTCQICHKIFTLKGNYDRHMRTHTGEKPFSCDICNKSFSQKSNLDNHMTIHSGEKPYTCIVCKKYFRYKSNLHEHKLIHNGIRPFPCSECDKSFRQKRELIEHKRIHTGDKPHTCDLCYKAFTQKTNLVRHKRLHTGEKPYSCDICNKSFTHKASLTYHTKTYKH